MTINFPGPYELRIFYTVNTLPHVMRLNTQALASPVPGTPFADIDIDDDILGSVDLETATDDLVALLRPFWPAANATIGRAELWQYETESFESSFISSYDIGLAGNAASGVVESGGQLIFVFRTLEGGVMKVNVLESVVGRGAPQLGTLAFAPSEALKNHFITGANRWIARDTSPPFAFIAAYPGVNEAIFKKRFRP